MDEPETFQAKNYRGLRILLRKHESGWLVNIFDGDGPKPLIAHTIPAKDRVVAESVAKRLADDLRDKPKVNPDENPDQKDVPEELRATWDEEENLRPTIQGDADPLTGDGSLRYTKDKRRRRLDEIDEEPE
ncbi:hypothetical protein SBA6_770020 [Candidatus Sulfopaludibacter sp. SbA6]|nr:hypothetical protein SBA6_770020 [Candidatus Sulfopaludibacter sp. SbA6]